MNYRFTFGQVPKVHNFFRFTFEERKTEHETGFTLNQRFAMLVVKLYAYTAFDEGV
jgi:hypothetical protein